MGQHGKIVEDGSLEHATEEQIKAHWDAADSKPGKLRVLAEVMGVVSADSAEEETEEGDWDAKISQQWGELFRLAAEEYQAAEMRDREVALMMAAHGKAPNAQMGVKVSKLAKAVWKMGKAMVQEGGE